MAREERPAIMTCEARAQPRLAGASELQRPLDRGFYLVQDPFGVRKAIVPLFRLRTDGQMLGLGTTFALDPWGRFLTAEHVVADFKASREPGVSRHARLSSKAPDAAIIAFLGMGVVFGRVGIPPEFMIPVHGILSLTVPVDNPIAVLQGRPASKSLDLAVLFFEHDVAGKAHTLPIRSRPPSPTVGDRVTAMGFAKIDTFEGDAQAANRISEGLYAAEGRVTELYPSGRDLAHPTPVFEVEGHWPSGMSGGPVFNKDGEVIGVVSRSLTVDGSDDGIGWATWLGAFELSRWVPSLTAVNPDWRRGWAVISQTTGRLVGVFPMRDQALQALPRYSDCEVRFVQWRIGSDDFVEEGRD